MGVAARPPPPRWWRVGRRARWRHLSVMPCHIHWRCIGRISVPVNSKNRKIGISIDWKWCTWSNTSRLSYRCCQQTWLSTTITTSFADNAIDLLWQNFLSPEFETVPEGSTLIFEDTQISLLHSVGQVEGSLCVKNELDPWFWHNNSLWQTERQTDGHTTTA